MQPMLQQNKNLMLIQFYEFACIQVIKETKRSRYLKMYFDTGRSICPFDIPVVLPVCSFLLLINEISWFI